jgi:hypothetical protein
VFGRRPLSEVVRPAAVPATDIGQATRFVPHRVALQTQRVEADETGGGRQDPLPDARMPP